MAPEDHYRQFVLEATMEIANGPHHRHHRNHRPQGFVLSGSWPCSRSRKSQARPRDHLDDKEFAKRVVKLAIRTCVPQALRAAASIHKDPKHVQAMRDAANKCEREPTEKNSRFAQGAATAAYAAAYAAAAATGADAKKTARDKSLADFAEGVVQILIEMKAPGCQWLALTEIAA